MRSVAIIANLVQVIIILLVFLLKGIVLGGWTITALFILLMIAFVNLLIILFHSPLAQKKPIMGASEKAAITKRQDLRVTYISEPLPTITIGSRRFSISDLSENGLRIRIGRNESLKKRLRGELALLCDVSFSVKASLIRREGDEAALTLNQPINYALLLKEKQAVSRQ